MPAQAPLAVDHEREQVRGAAQPAHGAELGERAREVAHPVGHHAQGLAGRGDPAGPAHRGLGVREGRVDVVGLEEGGHHHQVLRHPLGVLLRQGAQLVVDGTVELLAGHALGDARLGQPRTLRSQPGAAPALAVVTGVRRGARAPARGTTVTGCGPPTATVTATCRPALAAGATAVVSARGSPSTTGPAGRTARASATIAALLGHAINSSVQFGCTCAHRRSVYGCREPAPGRRERLLGTRFRDHLGDNEKGPA